MKPTTLLLAVVILHLVQGAFFQLKSTQLDQDDDAPKKMPLDDASDSGLFAQGVSALGYDTGQSNSVGPGSLSALLGSDLGIPVGQSNSVGPGSLSALLGSDLGVPAGQSNSVGPGSLSALLGSALGVPAGRAPRGSGQLNSVGPVRKRSSSNLLQRMKTGTCFTFMGERKCPKDSGFEERLSDQLNSVDPGKKQSSSSLLRRMKIHA